MIGMTKIAIIKGDREAEHSSAYATWAALQANGQDDYVLLTYADLCFYVGKDGVTCHDTKGNDLAAFNLVYIRDFHGYEYERNALALYLQQNDVTFINQDTAEFQDISKLTQYMRLAYAGVPVPESYYVHPQNFSYLLTDSSVSFPLIIKSISGSNGQQNFLVHTPEELATVEVNKPVIQRFLPNSFDYRVIVADDEVLLAYKRVRVDTSNHRNNVAAGAAREVVEVPEEVSRIAVAAAKATRRNLAGVDVLQNSETGEYAVLEVNFNFGMTELSDGVADEYYTKLANYLHDKATSTEG